MVPRRPFLILLLLAPALLLAALPPRPAGGAGVPAWSLEEGEDLPGRSVLHPSPASISFRHTLPPGRSVRYDLPLRWDGAGELLLTLRAARTNGSSTGYGEGRARFPAYVTVVFGQDSLSLGWRRRTEDFFRNLLGGFPPPGIRLTYAAGGILPVGSMYRLHDEETVFLLGGVDEAGRDVATRRDVRADYRAAYGKDPRGGVTRIVAGGERPSGEEGSSDAELRIELPAGAGEATAP